VVRDFIANHQSSAPAAKKKTAGVKKTASRRSTASA
jgi:hypothetical protein